MKLLPTRDLRRGFSRSMRRSCERGAYRANAMSWPGLPPPVLAVAALTLVCTLTALPHKAAAQGGGCRPGDLPSSGMPACVEFCNGLVRPGLAVDPEVYAGKQRGSSEGELVPPLSLARNGTCSCCLRESPRPLLGY